MLVLLRLVVLQILCRLAFANCPQGYFKVRPMAACRPWLNCSHLPHMTIGHLIGNGAVKSVYLAQWNSVEFAYSHLNNRKYQTDFQHGINVLIELSPSPYVVQLFGFCREENALWTEFHVDGNGEGVLDLLQRHGRDSVLERLNLCLNYAHVLNHTHSNNLRGARVMCDSNDLPKLLQQLLVTSDLKLVLNDVDAMPLVGKTNQTLIKCGSRKLSGSFVAPEQLWPFELQDFSDASMPGYDEKTDIWKAASVCDYFLGGGLSSQSVKYHLFEMHKRCKSRDPSKRPTALELLNAYKTVLRHLERDL